MLSLINIPFDERNDELLNMWKRFVKRYVNNTLDLKKEIENIFLTNDLESLELDHKKFDLIFSFMKAIHFENEEEYQLVKDKKLDISMKIIELLKKQKTNFKRCSKCGKKLSWNYPYGTCQDCYISSRRNSYFYDDFFDAQDWI